MTDAQSIDADLFERGLTDRTRQQRLTHGCAQWQDYESIAALCAAAATRENLGRLDDDQHAELRMYVALLLGESWSVTQGRSAVANTVKRERAND